MIRQMTVALSFVALVAAPLRAQFFHHPKPKADSSVVGTWDGTYTSSHASGGMQVVARRDGAWQVSVTIETPHGMSSSPVKDFAVKGKDVSWGQELLGMTCEARGQIESNGMKGHLDCGDVGVDFVLKKKGA